MFLSYFHSPNRRTFYFPELKNLNFDDWLSVTESYLEIDDVLKFESLVAWKGKKAAFDWLGQQERSQKF